MSPKYQFHRASVEDASAIFDIINEAYAVEHGNEGIAFKNCPRLDEPLEQFMLDAYEQKRIIKAVDESGKIVGMLSFEVNSDHVYFGPFAVSAAVKGTGLGKQLMNELHEIAYAAKVPYIDMNVVNWRADLIPMYEKMGFKQISEQPFPEPHKLTRHATLLMYRKVLVIQE